MSRRVTLTRPLPRSQGGRDVASIDNFERKLFTEKRPALTISIFTEKRPTLTISKKDRQDQSKRRNGEYHKQPWTSTHRRKHFPEFEF